MKIRIKAAELIEREGWMPGPKRKQKSIAAHPRCILVALWDARMQLELSITAYHAAAKEIQEELELEKRFDLIGWNDSPERKVEDVLEALKGWKS